MEFQLWQLMQSRIHVKAIPPYIYVNTRRLWKFLRNRKCQSELRMSLICQTSIVRVQRKCGARAPWMHLPKTIVIAAAHHFKFIFFFLLLFISFQFKYISSFHRICLQQIAILCIQFKLNTTYLVWASVYNAVAMAESGIRSQHFFISLSIDVREGEQEAIQWNWDD